MYCVTIRSASSAVEMLRRRSRKRTSSTSRNSSPIRIATHFNASRYAGRAVKTRRFDNSRKGSNSAVGVRNPFTASFNHPSGNPSASATRAAASRTTAVGRINASTSAVESRAPSVKHITAPPTTCSSPTTPTCASSSLSRLKARRIVVAVSLVPFIRVAPRLSPRTGYDDGRRRDTPPVDRCAGS